EVRGGDAGPDQGGERGVRSGHGRGGGQWAGGVRSDARRHPGRHATRVDSVLRRRERDAGATEVVAARWEPEEADQGQVSGTDRSTAEELELGWPGHSRRGEHG